MYRPLKKSNAGFTLLELLAILVILGIIVSMATLTVPDSAREQQKQEEQRLLALLALAQEEAVLQSRELAVEFWQSGYQFYLQTPAGWQALEQDNLLRQRQLIEGLELKLLLDGIEIVMDILPQDDPQIFILSSGEVSPFVLQWLWQGDVVSTITINALGQLVQADADA